ncbi:UPF0481 protein At3g47200-like [Zingiber officinale]|uniref:Uncharacterized protein n=1 Tax=Zingiber officinale TaxID=94328 RepID=A0A8J5G1Y6_ZINOF|nr:UPF0481 protein At3g47200-like [Zingiber officinale]KAG6498076.1 hypothetical protein ZIOFF_045985 [Zingiber officinale]
MSKQFQVTLDNTKAAGRKQESSNKAVQGLNELADTSKDIKERILDQQHENRKFDVTIDIPEEKRTIETSKRTSSRIFEQLLLDHDLVKTMQHSGKETSISIKEPPEAIDLFFHETIKIWLSLQDATNKNDGEYTIFRVPDIIRLSYSRASEPMIVPIGPYHHVHKRLAFREMEKHKPDCITYLLSLAPREEEEGELRKKCFTVLEDLESKGRSCYSDNTRLMESEHFTEMLLRDGCFIIYLLLSQEIDNREQTNESGKSISSVDKIRRPIIDTQKLNDIKLDLLKLENQIPFFIIQTLFEFIKPDLPPSSLIDLALKFFDDLLPSKPKNIQKPQVDEVHHLLHLVHMSLVPSTIHQMLSSESWEPDLPSIIDAPTWIPSAKELQQSGVKFRGNKDLGSILEIKFHEGTMEMPILQLYNSTAVLISNLVAFEYCYTNAGAHITSYVTFLSCLMHGEEDVRLLHLNGVVINKMSTDKKVAEFFSRICPQGPIASKPNHLGNLFLKVKDHHTRKKNIWMEEAKRKYCSSPCVTLSLVGGLCLLMLTFLQTSFTIIQTIHDLRK